MYRGPDRDIVAWNSALLDDMIYSQPVVYEFSDFKAPVLLMIGDKDTTAGQGLRVSRAPCEARRLPRAGQGGGVAHPAY